MPGEKGPKPPPPPKEWEEKTHNTLEDAAKALKKRGETEGEGSEPNEGAVWNSRFGGSHALSEVFEDERAYLATPESGDEYEEHIRVRLKGGEVEMVPAKEVENLKTEQPLEKGQSNTPQSEQQIEKEEALALFEEALKGKYRYLLGRREGFDVMLQKMGRTDSSSGEELDKIINIAEQLKERYENTADDEERKGIARQMYALAKRFDRKYEVLLKKEEGGPAKEEAKLPGQEEQEGPRIMDMNALRAASMESAAEPHIIPDLSEGDRQWVEDQIGGTPSQTTIRNRKMLESVGYTSKEIDSMTPFQTQFLVLGGRAAKEGLSIGRSADEQEELVLTGDQEVDQTPREAKKKLGERVRELESMSRPTPEQKRERRENRAKEFAEKFAVTREREAMLAVEREYQDWIARRESTSLRFLKKDMPQKLQEKYNLARKTWREALTASVNEKGSDYERIKAQAITFQDTVMRAEEARQAARLEGLDARSKTTFGKVTGWARKAALALPKGYMWTTEKAGSGMARAFTRDSAKLEARKQSYIRATRIVSSAAIGTVLLGGIGTAGVGLSLAIRAARGTFGVAIGTAAGYGAGKLYKGTVGERKHQNLRHAKRNQKGLKLKWQEESFARGNASSRARQQRTIEIVAALLGGGAAALGSGAALYASLGGSEAVQQAAQQIDTDGPVPSESANETFVEQADQQDPVHESETAASDDSEVETDSGAEELPAEEALVPSEIMARGVIDSPGEGTDSAFFELRAQVQETMTPEQIEQASPALRHFMESHPNVISREMGSEVFGEKGMLVHSGDQFYFDESGNLWYDPAEGDPQPYITNDASSTNGYQIHELEPQSPESMANEAAETDSADTMFDELQEQLTEKYTNDAGELDLTNATDLERMILERHPHVLGEAFGFSGEVRGPDGTVLGDGSRIMYEGDSLSINEQGELVFERDGEAHTLFNRSGPRPLGPLTSENTTLDQPASPALETVAAEQETSPNTEPTAQTDETLLPQEEATNASLVEETEVFEATSHEPIGRSLEERTYDSETIVEGAQLSQRPPDDIIGRSLEERGDAPASLEPIHTEPLVNSHGVEIDATEPARYTWQHSESGAEYQVAYGGTATESSELARAYVTGHPNSTVLFKDVRYDEFGRATEYMRAWNSNIDGQAELIDDVLDPATMSEPLPVANPDQFSRKLIN